MTEIVTKTHEIIVVANKNGEFKRKSAPSEKAIKAGITSANFYTIRIKEKRTTDAQGYIIPSRKSPVTVNVWSNNTADEDLYTLIEESLDDESLNKAHGANKVLTKAGYDCAIIQQECKPYKVYNSDGTVRESIIKDKNGDYVSMMRPATRVTYLVHPGESQQLAFQRATSSLEFLSEEDHDEPSKETEE